MLILFVLAGLTLFFGIIFLCSEATLKKLDNLLNKTVVKLAGSQLSKDKERIVGVLLIAFSSILFYIGLKLVR